MRTVVSFRCVACLRLTLGLLLGASSAQAADVESAMIFHVDRGDQKLEMTTGSTRVLEVPQRVQTAQVTDEGLLEVVPLSPYRVQLIAKKPGITHVNLWDEDNHLRTVNVIIDADARQLMRMLQRVAPDAVVQAIPMQGRVLLTGYVSRPADADLVAKVAEEYYPKGVINTVEVGVARQVLLRVRVLEVQRSKLRALGFNFQHFDTEGNVTSTTASSIGELFIENASLADVEFFPGESQIAFQILGQEDTFLAFLEALRQENLLKILAEPNLVAISGRPASFLLGGEFPFQVSQAFGQPPAIEFKPFGTRLDFVPVVMSNGRIRLEVRPEISEIRQFQESGAETPGLIARRVDTAVELAPGQTLAIAGLISNRVNASTQKIPFFGELPWIGAAFRRVRHDEEEVEMVVLVTPELVEGMDPEEVPHRYPGDESISPNDRELFLRGLIEVPSQAACAVPEAHAPARIEGSAVAGSSDLTDSTPSPLISTDGPSERSGVAGSAPSDSTPSPSAPKPLSLMGPHGYEAPDEAL